MDAEKEATLRTSKRFQYYNIRMSFECSFAWTNPPFLTRRSILSDPVLWFAHTRYNM